MPLRPASWTTVTSPSLQIDLPVVSQNSHKFKLPCKLANSSKKKIEGKQQSKLFTFVRSVALKFVYLFSLFGCEFITHVCTTILGVWLKGPRLLQLSCGQNQDRQTCTEARAFVYCLSDRKLTGSHTLKPSRTDSLTSFLDKRHDERNNRKQTIFQTVRGSISH